jgi:hypothetical protein
MSWGLWYGSGPWGACTKGGPDLLPPTISLESPAPGSSYVPFDVPISLRLNDDLSGVDLGSVRITVQQGSMPVQVMFQNGLISPAFRGPGCLVQGNLTNGFDFILVPVSPWISGATVTVTVTASDAQCNSATFSWSFQMTSCYGCVT